MNENADKNDQRITLDPENTPQGVMERVMLAETHPPSYVDYNSNITLEEMREIRQVIENRMLNPGKYGARGAKTEVYVVRAPGQFAGFENYPNIDKEQQKNIDDDLQDANGKDSSKQQAYQKFLQYAKTAATESIVHPVAEYTNATAWRTKHSKGPGSGFHVLGDIGGNTFYAPESQSPADRARALAAQARADAANRRTDLERHHKAILEIGKPSLGGFAPRALGGHAYAQPSVAPSSGSALPHAAAPGVTGNGAIHTVPSATNAAAALAPPDETPYYMKSPEAFVQAVDDYFFQRTHQPLSTTMAFNARLSPLYPGMKIPG